MANTLSTTVSAGFRWDLEKVDAVIGNTVNSNAFSYSKTMTTGTGANQVDLVYVVTGTIVASGNLQLDLAGVLADFFGATISFARIKAMYIELTTDTTSTGVSVGGGTDGSGAAAFINWVGDVTDKIKLRNGGCFTLTAPDATAYAVTATTADILRLTNLDASNVATYKIGLAGASA